MILFKRRAFTLIEIIVAAGVTAIFLGMAVTLFLRFSKMFSAGEGSAVLMQDCALFVARLRNDLNNAVKPKEGEFIEIDKTNIKFNVYDSEEGKVKPIIYTAIPQADGFYNISRRIANGSEKLIVKGKIAAYSWSLNVDSIPTGATPIKRLGLVLDLKMGSSDLKNKSFDFKTTIYPVRYNKMQ
jgi:Tfp pilus assembly protein PilE